MKKYKLAQKCEQELARLDPQQDRTKQEELLRERALAIAAAVDALAKLHHKETIAKLQKIVRQNHRQDKHLQILHSNVFLNSRDPLF